MKKLLCLLFAVMAVWTSVSAQQFPVQVNAQLAPPYSLIVSDYYSTAVSGTEKLKVILVNKDLQRASLQVRLRLIIESQSVRIRTREDVAFTPITLVSGTPYYVSPAELQQYFRPENLEFSGISQGEYEQSGKLPEGFYSFCLEAVEVQGGQTVSNRSCAFAWMTLSDPPFLNLPLRGESITPRNPQNIVFHWTPRHTASVNASFSTDYIFSIAEIQDSTVAPEAAFTTNAVLYSQNVGSVTTFLYDAGKPQLVPGKRYAWRVQAVGRSGGVGLAAFKNQGYSETWWFTYQSTCAAPLGVSATLQGQNVVVSWQTNPQHLEYRLEYREKNNGEAEWFSKTNTLPSITLTDLKAATQYEYRVGGSCDEGVYTFGALLSFTTNGAEVNNVPNCGDSSLIPATVQQNLLQTLLPGDSIKAGDFTVIVTECSGSASFTGKGYVKVPWLMYMKVAVQFNGIGVNTDKRLVMGRIETPYDPNEGGIGDVDEYIDAYVGGNEVGRVISGLPSAEEAVNFLVQMPGGIQASFGAGYDSTTGKGPVTLTLTPAGGGTTQTITTDHLPTTIQDSGGNIYQVDKNGGVSSIGKAGGDALLSKTNKSHVDTDKGVVKFVDYPGRQVYAFDEWRSEYKKSGAFNKKYERLNDDYYVSAKAIAPGKTDYLKAVVTLKDNTLSADSILFVSGKGTIYERTKKAEGVYEIAVVGGPEKDAQEIYALYKQGGGKTLNLGKVLVASYPRREFKVKLVLVNGATVNVDSVKSALNEAFAKLNISFLVTEDVSFTSNEWDINKDGKLDIEGSNLFTKNSPEMYALMEQYRSLNTLEDDYKYLFVVPNCNGSTSVAGEMIRGKGYGFIFQNKINQGNVGPVVAHELGHGLFNLKHTFEDYGFSQDELADNLMNYGNHVNLAKLQWDLIHDPGIAISLFDNQKDIEYVISEGIIRNVFSGLENISGDTKLYTFLTPAGNPITLPDSASSVRFSTKDPIVDSKNQPTGQYSPIGALTGFKLNNKEYLAKYSGNDFLYYSSNISGDPYYSETVTPSYKPSKAIIALPWFTGGKLGFSAFQISTKQLSTSDNYSKNQEQKYVGHGAALVNNFSIIDKLKENVSLDEYSGYSEEFISLFAQAWNLISPHKRLESPTTNLGFTKGAFDYLQAHQALTSEGSILAPLIISNAHYLSGFYTDPNISCIATERLKEFDTKIKELELTSDVNSFTKTKLEFLNTYYSRLKRDLTEYSLNSGTTQTRDINELIRNSKNSQTIFLNDLFPLLESKCLYSNITSSNRILLLESLIKYADDLTSQANPPFPVSLFVQSPEEVCKSVMQYIIDVIDDARYSNQQYAVVKDLFYDKSSVNLDILYKLGKKPYVWLRTDVMKIFSLITEAAIANATINPQNFSFQNTGTSAFNSSVDYINKRITLERNGVSVQYGLFDLIKVFVPTSNSFLIIDEAQSGDKEYQLPAFLVHHLIRLQLVDNAWKNEADQIRIVLNISAMISAIPTGGASLEADAALFYWLSGADIMITMNKPLLEQTQSGKNFIEAWDQVVAAIAIYKMGEYIYFENSGIIRLKINDLKNVIKSKWSDWLGVEKQLRSLLNASSRLNVSYYSSCLITRTEHEIEDMILKANFNSSLNYEIGINSNNKAYLLKNGKSYEFLTFEGLGNWYGTEVNSKSTLPSDEKLGSVLKGRFLKPNGQVAEHEYDLFYRSTTDEVFVARNSNYIHWDDIESALDINGAIQHIKFRDLNVPRSSGIGGCHDLTKFFDNNIIRQVNAINNPNYQVEVGKNISDVEEIIIISNDPHITIPGVRIVNYKIPALDYQQKTTGALKGRTSIDPFTKTVYDPVIWTDVKLNQALKEAVQDALNKSGGILRREWTGVTSEGYNIRGYTQNGRITSFYFE